MDTIAHSKHPRPKRPVLVVDDDVDIREAEEDVLTLEGYEVFTAAHGVEALRVLEEQAPGPCLILLDLMMPVMNGLEFIAELRVRMPERLDDVIVVSADLRALDRVQEVGIDRVLKKPFSFTDLMIEVRAHCGA